MNARKALLAVGIGAILTSAAYCGAPIGPPMALMGEGNWGVGAEIGHEEIDLEASGTLYAEYDDPSDLLAPNRFNFLESLEIENLEINMIFGTLAYGLCDTWDVFVRLGAADAGDEVTGTGITEITADPGVQQEYAVGRLDSGYGFAWGVGTRATFCQSGPWSFGGLVQVTRFSPADTEVAYTDPFQGPDAVHMGDMSIEFWQTQVALAAIYQADTTRLWVGPLLQFIDGDLDRDGSVPQFPPNTIGNFDGSSDIRQESWLGAHAGVDWEVNRQFSLRIEGQMTSDSWFIGAGFTYRPGETFGM